MVPKDDMFIYFYCFLYAYDIISLVPHHVVYISIMLVLLCIYYCLLHFTTH